MCSFTLYWNRYNFRWHVCLFCFQRHNDLLHWARCLETIESTFYAVYYISWKIACVRNSPTLNCYALGNGLRLCTWKRLNLQAIFHGKIKTQKKIHFDKADCLTQFLSQLSFIGVSGLQIIGPIKHCTLAITLLRMSVFIKITKV